MWYTYSSHGEGMIRWLFTLAAALSLLIALLLSAAMVWGRIAPATFLWARGGTLGFVDIDRNTLDLGRLDGWPRDEPVIHVPAGNLVCVSTPKSVLGAGRWDRWFCSGQSEWAGIGIGPLMDPWGYPRPPKLNNMTTIRLMLQRCIGIGTILPIAWLICRFRLRKRILRGFDVEPVRS